MAMSENHTSLKKEHRIHLIAIILALVTGLLLAYPDIVAILKSTISTAAIGFIYLPFEVAPAIILVLLIYYLVIFSLRRFREKKLLMSVIYGVISISLLLYSGFYLTNNYIKPYRDYKIIASIIAPIPKMNNKEINQLIDNYFSFSINADQRIFILNSILERDDLSSGLLDKISKIKDPALHDKLYSRYGLLGKNTKGLSVARLVALHHNTSSSTLTFLGEIDEPYLQGDVSGNENTPVNSLISLYEKSKNNKDGYLIEWGLSRNKNTPIPILKELSLSSNEYTRIDAERTLKETR
jgi:hypothetical protein